MSRRTVWPARFIIPLSALGIAYAWMLSAWFAGIALILLLALASWFLLRLEKRWRREDSGIARETMARDWLGNPISKE